VGSNEPVYKTYTTKPEPKVTKRKIKKDHQEDVDIVKPKTGKQTASWDDIISSLQAASEASKGPDDKEDPVKFAEFKRQALAHLDDVAKEEAKKTKTVSFLEEEARFGSYDGWDDTVYTSVNIFYDKHTIYPNIMLASKSTYDKIDLSIKEHGTQWLEYEGDEDPPPEFSGGVDSFNASDFELWFCLDDRLDTDTFRLIYDDDPSFDGEDNEGEKPWQKARRVFPAKRLYQHYRLAA
jgi:hypothetical protein